MIRIGGKIIIASLGAGISLSTQKIMREKGGKKERKSCLRNVAQSYINGFTNGKVCAEPRTRPPGTIRALGEKKNMEPGALRGGGGAEGRCQIRSVESKI